MPLLTLIRHAQSIANAGVATSSPELIPLSEEGHREAEAIVTKITPVPSLIVHSAYLRTKQTAAPLIAQYPQIPVEVWELHEFTYIAPTRVENTTFAERRPIVEEYWQRNDPHFVDGEGAESFADFVARIDRCIERTRASNHAHIVAFSHALVMKVVELRLANPALSLQESMATALHMQRSNPVHNTQIDTHQVNSNY